MFVCPNNTRGKIVFSYWLLPISYSDIDGPMPTVYRVRNTRNDIPRTSTCRYCTLDSPHVSGTVTSIVSGRCSVRTGTPPFSFCRAGYIYDRTNTACSPSTGDTEFTCSPPETRVHSKNTI